MWGRGRMGRGGAVESILMVLGDFWVTLFGSEDLLLSR